jgi:NADH-quinone oxidoreductase subunit L
VHEVSHTAEWILMGVATVIAIMGILMAWFYFKSYQSQKTNTGVSRFFENKWYIDEMYDGLIVKPLQSFSRWTEQMIEKSGIDGIVNGVGRLIQYSSNKLRLLQSGLVGFYLFMIVAGMILLFVIQIWFNKF